MVWVILASPYPVSLSTRLWFEDQAPGPSHCLAHPALTLLPPGPLHTQLVPQLRNVLFPTCARTCPCTMVPILGPNLQALGPTSRSQRRFLPFCGTTNKCQENQWVFAEAPEWNRDRGPTPPAPACLFLHTSVQLSFL